MEVMKGQGKKGREERVQGHGREGRERHKGDEEEREKGKRRREHLSSLNLHPPQVPNVWIKKESCKLTLSSVLH